MQHHIAEPRDTDLRAAVEAALAIALGDKAPHIGVAVDQGTVTLTGPVGDYDTHVETLHTVEAVDGVHAIADELDTSQLSSSDANDTVIAAAAQRVLQHCDGIPIDSVVPEVRDKVLTLTGVVSSVEERFAAERAVFYLPGLVRINNRIHVQPKRPGHEVLSNQS